MAGITSLLLNSYLGRHIDDICPNRFQAANHCAHFVSHVLSLRFGYTCGGLDGVNVRVHEIFARCTGVQELHECRERYEARLLFVTGLGNVRLDTQSMDNVPKKHIGIACGTQVWHYSNSRREVVSQPVDEFIYHYPRQRNGLWLGEFPVGANPQEFGVCAPVRE